MLYHFFYKTKVSFRIFVFIILGIILGLACRLNPEFGSFIGVAKFKILGSLFLNLIKMISVPLVFFSIVLSIISIGDTKKTGIIAVKSIVIFLTMTAFSVILGMIIAKIVLCNHSFFIDKEKLFDDISINMNEIISNVPQSYGIGDFIFNIIPNNIFNAFLKADFLQIIFLGIFLGICILKSDGNLHERIVSGIESILGILTIGVRMIMELAPFGIFGITTWMFGTQDIQLIRSLGILIMIEFIGSVSIIYIFYTLILFFVAKLNPLKFFRKIIPIQILGFFTSSSSSILPTTMALAREKLGVSTAKVNFIIPLGATINMNGGAMHFGVCIIFFATIFSYKLTIYQYIIGFFMSILCAIGTSPIPGTSIFLLGCVLSSVGLPLESIGIVFAVDRILDMIRTLTNISGDICSAVIVDKLENTLNKTVYNAN